MFNWIAGLLGYRVVWLLDFDGEVRKVWARVSPFGLTCGRLGFISPRILLRPDGTTSCSWVEEWRYAEGEPWTPPTPAGKEPT